MKRIPEIKGQNRFIGTSSYYRVSLLPYVLTDGTKFIADEGKCYWLFDELMLMIKDTEKVSELFVCTLSVNGDTGMDKGIIKITDGNRNLLVKKELTTDFPAHHQKVWASYSVINSKKNLVFFLPSEY